MRALYHLFDLDTALDDDRTSPERIIEAFQAYMGHGGHGVSRAQCEETLAGKLKDTNFTADIGPLLAVGYERGIEDMVVMVLEGLIARLPGEPWHRTTEGDQ